MKKNRAIKNTGTISLAAMKAKDPVFNQSEFTEAPTWRADSSLYALSRGGGFGFLDWGLFLVGFL